jgi:hypothetical protein
LNPADALLELAFSHAINSFRSLAGIMFRAKRTLGAKPARMGEHGRFIFGNMSVKQDANLSVAQEPRQRSLPVQEREIAQILAIMLDQVEGLEDRCSSRLSAAQLLEP